MKDWLAVAEMPKEETKGFGSCSCGGRARVIHWNLLINDKSPLTRAWLATDSEAVGGQRGVGKRWCQRRSAQRSVYGVVPGWGVDEGKYRS